MFNGGDGAVCMYVMVWRQVLIFLTSSRWEEEDLFKYTMPLVCCYVEISQYVAAIMFALISCLIGEAGEGAYREGLWGSRGPRR